jgi:hypothetical protein
MDEIIITLETNDANVMLESDELDANLDNKISIIEPRQHSDLQGLDYESSGHTGFASSQQLTLLVPKRLSTLPNLSATADRTKANLYVDNDGNDSKVAIATMLNYMLRKGETVPSDMQKGEYLFLELKEE